MAELNKIVWENADGTVGIFTPSGEVPLSECYALPGLSATLAAALQVKECTPAEAYPDKKLYRNAYRMNGAGLPEPEVTLAREVAHARRRAKRTEVFAPHDEVVSKVTQGTPLSASERANYGAGNDAEAKTAAQAARTNYKTTVDDVAQAAIDAAADWTEIKVAEQAGGWIA